MNCDFSKLSQSELAGVRRELEERYAEFQARNLKLNMARGKPGAEQLDISDSILESANPKFAADGSDCRNYGVLEGLPEMRKFFGDVLGIDPANIIIGGNDNRAAFGLRNAKSVRSWRRHVHGGRSEKC